MKELMIMVFIAMLILIVIFFPRQETYTFVSHEKEEIYAYTIEIQGAVYQEGYYTFYEPMTLREILMLSTYTKDDADLEALNLDQIYDQDATIFIPSINEALPIYEKININEADFQMFLEVPGMQERQAASIIIYREANGLFESVDELVNVKYIGAITLEKLKPYLTT